jgi:4-diphosphocytidyl-2-C-methyl-D-erythritol kinase
VTSALPLRALAPAKINLGLFVGPPTDGGRHELVTVMQSISLADELVLEWLPPRVADADASGERARRDEVICPGVSGPPSQNLATAALEAFRRARGWDAPPMRLSIVKRVPVAGGLGGGSGDAAAVLRLAAHASGCQEDPPLDLAARLGSDVPAQLRPGRWLASGTGERLEQLPDPQPPFGVLVLATDASLATAEVYAEADRLRSTRGRDELAGYHRALREALGAGAPLPPPELIVNDLEEAARSLCPAIDECLDTARAAGAEVALVSGSGPTVVGLFVGADGVARAQRASGLLERASRGGARLFAIAAEPVQPQFAAPVKPEGEV